MSEVRFTLHGAPPSLANLRGYWRKAKVVKEWREYTWYAAAAARVLATSPAMRHIPDKVANPVRRRVTIVIHRARLLDPDNAYASVKGVVDGLTGQLIVDDSAAWLSLVVLQTKVDKVSQQRVEISCSNWTTVEQEGTWQKSS